ncbi:tetratricopeptide repeat protein [Allohahella marinimesophila]|uniref:PEP-CTERM system TPR-repeat lipoprotein n=1 Tax=Allohahella marinimesophila TaxID=1054972 RepID=A0ABP7P987_9GAMM
MNSRVLLRSTLFACVYTSLVACSSPEEKSRAFYEKGESHLASGDLSAANVEFRNALEYDKGNTDALFGIAKVYEAEAKWPELYRILKRVVAEDPDNTEARARYARLLLAAGQLDEALKQTAILAKALPEDPDTFVMRAGALFQVGDEAGGQAALDKAVQLDPDNSDALLLMATRKMAEGDAKAALALLDRGVKQTPKSMSMQLMKVQALNELEDYTAAIGVFQQLVDYYPDNTELVKTLARQFMIAGRKDEAATALKAHADRELTPVSVLAYVEFVLGVESAAAAAKVMEGYLLKVEDRHTLIFALADLHIRNGQPELAEKLMADLAKEEGDSAIGLQAKNQLVSLAYMGKDVETAKKLVEEVLVADPKNAAALTHRARNLLIEGDAESAIRELRAAQRIDPGSSEILLLLAKAHRQQGDTALAADYYGEAVDAGKAGTNAESQADLVGEYASFLMSQKDYQQADTLVTPYVGDNATSVKLLQLAAQIKLSTGQWTEAQRLAERLHQLGEGDATVEQIRGTALMQQAQFDAGINSFKQAQAAAPQGIRPMAALVGAYVKADKRADAEAFLKDVLKTDPKNIYAYILQGSLFAHYGEADAALQSYAKAREVAPEKAEGYLEGVNLLVRLQRYKDAETLARSGMPKVDDKLALTLALGQLLESQRRPEEAAEVYSGLLETNPEMDVVANNLASILSASEQPGDLERAAKLAERFRTSKIPHFQDTLGWIYYKQNKLSDAKYLLEQAAEAFGDHPEVNYHLGMVLVAQNRFSRARELLQMAAASEVDFVGRQEARDALAKL